MEVEVRAQLPQWQGLGPSGSLTLFGISWRHLGLGEMSQGERAYAHLAGKAMVEKVN